MLRDIKPRLYQETIFATCSQKNTLVVLPTGMGKSILFVMLIAQRLCQYPDSKVLVLAPTKPLCEQHITTLRRHLELPDERFALFTGNISPDKRQALWSSASVIVSTPQTIENDVINRRVLFERTSLMVVDECHRAVNDYSYVWLAKQYNSSSTIPLILGLTASPGSDLEKITSVCHNLFIEAIEARVDEDPDVRPYVQDVKTDWLKVDLPDIFKQVLAFLSDCYNSKLDIVKRFGYATSDVNKYSKTQLLALQAGLHSRIAQGEKEMEILRSVSLIAEAMKVQHAIELAETQSIASLVAYFDKIDEEARSSKVKAVVNLSRDVNFRSASIKAHNMLAQGLEHPKLAVLTDLVTKCFEKRPESKVIVFTQFRDTASKIEEVLRTKESISARIFVGQAKKGGTGMSQKMQIDTLDRFKSGEFNVLVMTSVGEEGLDIPKVDHVIFYEPIPSAIRTIQRKGRTGRHDDGSVTILVANGTRDEAYRWSAHHKEKRMYAVLDKLKRNFEAAIQRPQQPKLQEFVKDDGSTQIKAYVDFREKSSGVVRELVELGVSVKTEKLDCADYVLSDRVAVEFKTVSDFVDSIVDGRLLSQIKELKDSYARPVIIIEGTQSIYQIRNVHPNAIRGALATISVSYGIPLLHTKDCHDTASLIYAIAKREQCESTNVFSPHASRKPMFLREQQEYIVSALPGIGLTLAKPLLKTFGSVGNVLTAREDQLREVEKIGEKKAKDIRKVIDERYVC